MLPVESSVTSKNSPTVANFLKNLLPLMTIIKDRLIVDTKAITNGLEPEQVEKKVIKKFCYDAEVEYE